MKYILLSFLDEDRWNALNPTERAAFVSARHLFDEELRSTGQVLAVGRLALNADAFLLREAAGPSATVTARALKSLRELVVIEARDLNEAIRVASNHPAARIGETLGWAVEIRPLESFEPAPNQRTG